MYAALDSDEVTENVTVENVPQEFRSDFTTNGNKCDYYTHRR